MARIIKKIGLFSLLVIAISSCDSRKKSYTNFYGYSPELVLDSGEIYVSDSVNFFAKNESLISDTINFSAVFLNDTTEHIVLVDSSILETIDSSIIVSIEIKNGEIKGKNIELDSNNVADSIDYSTNLLIDDFNDSIVQDSIYYSVEIPVLDSVLDTNTLVDSFSIELKKPLVSLTLNKNDSIRKANDSSINITNDTVLKVNKDFKKVEIEKPKLKTSETNIDTIDNSNSLKLKKIKKEKEVTDTTEKSESTYQYYPKLKTVKTKVVINNDSNSVSILKMRIDTLVITKNKLDTVVLKEKITQLKPVVTTQTKVSNPIFKKPATIDDINELQIQIELLEDQIKGDSDFNELSIDSILLTNYNILSLRVDSIIDNLEVDKKAILKDSLTIYFKVNRHDINLKDENRLNTQLVKNLIKNTNLIIVIEGFSDKNGSKEYNMYLSYLRAFEIKKKLMEIGIISENIYILNQGELKATAMNSPLERKVEIKIYKNWK